VLTSHNVEVWLIRTGLPDPVLDRLETVLDDGERARARALVHPVDRRRFIAAHGAVRLILGRCLGAPAASLCWRYGPHGKPELTGTDVRVSLSHSADLAALAVTAGRRVGVDVQRVLADLAADRLATRFYPAAEARFVLAAGDPADRVDRFTRLWTRKEACQKVTGGRLLPGLTQHVLGRAGDDDQPWFHAGFHASFHAGFQTGTALVRDLLVPPGFRGAVAAEGAAPYRITTRRWSHQQHKQR
jgi:4'-phosphopantetheinyl transferase